VALAAAAADAVLRRHSSTSATGPGNAGRRAVRGRRGSAGDKTALWKERERGSAYLRRRRGWRGEIGRAWPWGSRAGVRVRRGRARGTNLCSGLACFEMGTVGRSGGGGGDESATPRCVALSVCG
jgi:hypothetical protein